MFSFFRFSAGFVARDIETAYEPPSDSRTAKRAYVYDLFSVSASNMHGTDPRQIRMLPVSKFTRFLIPLGGKARSLRLRRNAETESPGLFVGGPIDERSLQGLSKIAC